MIFSICVLHVSCFWFHETKVFTIAIDSRPLRHYQPFIPTALLVVPAGDFPELRFKAWSSRVITAFVSVCLQDLSARYTSATRPPLLAAATMACAKLSEWMLLVEKYPRFLTEEQAEHLYNVGWETLSCYKT